MHHVQQHPDAHGVCLVHQIFQVFRLSEPGGSGEEIAHLIAEGAVIGMLHNGHELEGIVAGLLDSRQDVVGKFPVGADLALLLRHADVGFIDIQLVLARKILVRPVEGLPVVHNFALESDGLLVLHHPAGIQGDVLRAGQVGVHHGLDLAAVPQGVVAGEVQLPVAVAQIRQRVGGLVPAVEFALQIQLVGTGRPLPVVPAAVHMVEAEVHVGVGKIVQALSLGQNTLFGRTVQVHPQINIPGERLQLGIQIQNTIHSVSFSAQVLSNPMEGGITLRPYFRRIGWLCQGLFNLYNSVRYLISILHTEDFGIYIRLVKCES